MSNSNPPARFVIKSKNEKFSENSKKKSKTPRTSEAYYEKLKADGESEEVINMIKDSENYVNQNRLNNVMSHYGNFDDMKNFTKYITLFMEDFQNDFINDNTEFFDNNDIKRIKKLIFSQANKLSV
jgi:hypothetical protein